VLAASWCANLRGSRVSLLAYASFALGTLLPPTASARWRC
jgi:hypothetical protein